MTSEAPKEVWTGACGKALVTDGMKRWEGDVKYIRADRAQAMVAAEREACAQVAKDAYVRMEKLGLEPPEGSASRSRCFGRAREAMYISETILARTPDDAQAALDALLRAERVKALREAADCIGHITRAEDQDAIIALIEKETSHE